MGNSCESSNYLIEPNYHFIETNANYDRLNKIIEHISDYNDPDQSKLLSAIQNCRINQLPHNINEEETSSNFSIKHGQVINDEDKVDINLSYISALDKTFTSRFNESSIFVDRSQSRKISKKISPIEQNKRKTVMNHLSNNNLFSKLELAKLQAKNQNLNDESVKSNKKKKKQLSVIKLLNTYKSNPDLIKNSISIREEENILEKNNNLEVTNVENISVFATQIAKKKNEEKEIQEEFFSIAPTSDREEELRKKEEAHKNNILEKLMQIISLDNNNKFVFNKTNLEKVNEFSIEGEQPKKHTHIVSEVTSSRNSKRNQTGMNSFRNQKTYSRQMSSCSPLLLRKGTSIIEKEINSKITERKKETKEFFNNVIFYSELKKVINITDRIIYATRFCVLTGSEFKCFKSKEEYIMVREPLLVISLYAIKNVNFVNMNRRGVQKNKNTHFGLNYYKINLNSSSGESSVNYKRRLSQIDEDVEVEFFGSADSKLIKRWIKEINKVKNIEE